MAREPAPEAHAATSDRQLQARQWPSEPALSLRGPHGQQSRGERTLQVAEAVFARLGDLDPGEHGQRAAADGERQPGLLGIAMAPKAPE